MMVSYFGGRCLLVEERERGEEPRAALFLPQTKTSKVRTLEKKSQVILSEPGGGKVKDAALVIDAPGEYDISQFAIRGIGADDALLYVLDGKHLTFGFLTKSPGRALNDGELERAGEVDILAVPMPFGSEKEPVEKLGAFIRPMEPKIVILLTEKPKLKKAAASELGAELKDEKKLTATVRDLPEDGFQLVGLEVQ